MTSHGEMFRSLPFPFPDDRFPDNLGAVVQRTVLDGTAPAREVAHYADGAWTIADGVSDPNLPGAAVATHIWHAIACNSSIAGLATMPPGSIAQRSGPGEPWQITDLDEDEE